MIVGKAILDLGVKPVSAVVALVCDELFCVRLCEIAEVINFRFRRDNLHLSVLDSRSPYSCWPTP